MSHVLNAIADHARHRATAPAISGNGTALSYRDLVKGIAQAASALDKALDRQGPLAIALDNGPAWAVLDLACIELQRTTLPLPPFFNTAQIQHTMNDAGAVALITDRPRAGPEPRSTLGIAGQRLDLYRLDSAGRGLPTDTAKITYSSGTTGQPKGVCLSRAGVDQVACSLLEVIGADYAGVHCAVLPLGVLLENVAGLYTTLLAGGRYHAAPLAEIGFARPFAPDFATLATALAETRATSTILVPEILRGLMAAMARSGRKLDALHLVAVGGARLSPKFLEQAEALGLPVLQGYGLSEAASVVAVNRPDDNVAGSVGTPLPHIEVSIAEDGEILLEKAPFLGYVGSSVPDTPYPTGDLGYFDAGGHLYVTGRKDHLIVNSFGRNIAPEWVESELLARPEFAQAVVFGTAQPALSAVIVPTDPDIEDARLTQAVCAVNATLPDYAHIRHWRRATPFTLANGQLTGTGRPRRHVLEKIYGPMLNTDCASQDDAGSGFFGRLIRETDGPRTALFGVPQIIDGLAGRISRETYIAYLTEAYHHVKHTVPLLTLARDRLPTKKAWIADVLTHYIDEERGHEHWILDDIHNAGGNADAARRSRPRMATEVMIAYAYDTINRINPVALFGMVFVLEGTSTALAIEGAESLMTTLQLPKTCFRYLLSHGSLDIEHMAFFESLANRIYDPQDQADIIHMADRMFTLYGAVFSSIPHGRKAQHAA